MAGVPDSLQLGEGALASLSENASEPMSLEAVLRQHGLNRLADRFSSGAAKCTLDDFLLMQQAELRQWTDDLNELDDLVKAWRYACTTCSQRRAELQQSSPSDSDGRNLVERDQCAKAEGGEYSFARKNSLSFPRSMKTGGRRALRELEQSDDHHDSGCVADTGHAGTHEPPSNLLASQKLGNSEPNIHSPIDALSARTEGMRIRRKQSLKRPRSMYVSSESVEKVLGSPENQSPQPPFAAHHVGRHPGRRDRRWSVTSSMASTSSGYNTSSSPAWSITSSHDGLHHLPSQPTPDDFQGFAAKLMSSEDSQDELRTFRSRSRSLSPSRYPQPWLDMPSLNRFFRENFPKAKIQMEENLKEFLEGANEEILTHQHADATISFVTKQLHELAQQLLSASQDGTLSNDCFKEVTDNLLRLYEEISNRSSATDSTLIVVQHLVQRLLSIMSRPARLLECLEFDPESFLQEVTVSQDEAHEKLAALKSSHTVPRYIQSRLKQLEEGADGITSRCMSPAISRSASPVRDGLHRTGSDAAVAETSMPKEGSFETVKLISNGAYSSVHLVRHKDSQKLFAMKKVSKINSIRKKQVEQVFCERDILTFAENPFVVSMICTFETKKHLCMVLEYVEGGDCATLLKNMQGPIPLELARLYFAETVLALEYLHNYGVVHRDVKPDNLLITSEGHIKLTDFGLSKMGLMSYATTMYESGLAKQQVFTDEQVYGTPDYIAPEVILRSGYGFPVDWWAMGIILYEFLVGLVPFYGENVDELFDQITSEEVEPEFPEDVPLPDEAVTLIKSLLVRAPSDRLGSHGAEEVKHHRFFQQHVNWRNLLLQKAEFVPHLDNPEDTSYFDPRTDRYNHTLEGEDEVDGPMEINLNNSFQGFTSVSPRFMAINSPSNSRRTSASEGMDILSDSSSPSPHRSISKSMSIHSRSLSSSSNTSTFKQIAEGDEEHGSIPATPELNLQPPTPNDTPMRFCSPLSSPATSPIPSEQGGGGGGGGGGRIRSKSSPYRPPNLHLNSSNMERIKLQEEAATDSGVSVSLPSSPKPSVGSTHAALASMAASLTSVGSPRRQAASVYTVERGPQGYGMELRAIRVYLGESDKYCVQHIVKEVVVGSNAWKVGIRPEYLILAIDGVEAAGLKHTDIVQLLLAGGKKKCTFTMLPLEDSSISSHGRKRLASVSRRVSSREEGTFMRQGSGKRRNKINVPQIFSRSRQGSRKNKEGRDMGKRSRSNSDNTNVSMAASPPATSPTSQPTTPSPKTSRSSKSGGRFSFGKLARILNKPRKPSQTISPLALTSSGNSSTLSSPTGTSPPTSRSFLMTSPHTVTGCETAQSVGGMRRAMSASQVPSPTSLAPPTFLSPTTAAAATPPVTVHKSQHAAVMHDIKSSGSPLLRRALSPDPTSPPPQQSFPSPGGSSSCEAVPSPLAPGHPGNSSPSQSPGQHHGMRRASSTTTPSRSRARSSGGRSKKISWEERKKWFDQQ